MQKSIRHRKEFLNQLCQLSLKIDEPELRSKFAKMRFQSFNKLWLPVSFVSLASIMLIITICKGWHDLMMGRSWEIYFVILWLFFWAFLKWLAPRLSPRIVYVLPPLFGFYWFANVDSNENQDVELKVAALLTVIHYLNYNSIIENLLILPLFIMIPHACIVEKIRRQNELSMVDVAPRVLFIVLFVFVHQVSHFRNFMDCKMLFVAQKKITKQQEQFD